MFDTINFKNFNEIQVNNSINNRTNEKRFINNFEEALNKLNNKMNCLLQKKNNNSNSNNNNKSDNIIQRILDNNIYVSSKFKSNKIKKNNKPMLSTSKNKVITKNNIKENNINLSSIKKSQKINIQNIYIQDNNYNKNLEEISSHINIPNNINTNNNNLKLLGNKRNYDDKFESQKEKIYKEIKSIYNKYKNEKNNDEGISIYDVDCGFFEKNETVIIGNPICIIYFNRKLINSIFLIREQTIVSDNKEIIEVLNKVKKDLSEHILKKKI